LLWLARGEPRRAVRVYVGPIIGSMIFDELHAKRAAALPPNAIRAIIREHGCA
jgi:hypothetical protein